MRTSLPRPASQLRELIPLTHSPRTALDQGLEDGFTWAKAHLADRARLGRIVRAHTAVEVVANLDPTFQMPDGVADSVAYWSGFAHGVQRAVRDTAGESISHA
jgi:hypothetical protein